jgi:hypothetical protein
MMKSAIIAASAVFLMIPRAHAAEAWINEIHYDNIGADIGEFVEVAGVAGTDLSGWELVLYNGSKGTPYASQKLGGVVQSDGASAFGALAFSFSSIQNGSPDGIALVDQGGSVVQLLSYEGRFAAASGPAMGLTSSDIGVFETVDTPLGYSLQLAGKGADYEALTWLGAGPASPGRLNDGQALSAVPVPAALPMFAGAIASLGFVARRKSLVRGAGSTHA